MICSTVTRIYAGFMPLGICFRRVPGYNGWHAPSERVVSFSKIREAALQIDNRSFPASSSHLAQREHELKASMIRIEMV